MADMFRHVVKTVYGSDELEKEMKKVLAQVGGSPVDAEDRTSASSPTGLEHLDEPDAVSHRCV